MLNHPSQGSDDAQDEKQGDFPVIEEEKTQAVMLKDSYVSNDVANSTERYNLSPSPEDEDFEAPTEEEMQTLRHVGGKIPMRCWLIAIVELSERFSYYGLSAPFQNYMEYGPNDSPKGVLSLNSQGATGLSYFSSFGVTLHQFSVVTLRTPSGVNIIQFVAVPLFTLPVFSFYLSLRFPPLVTETVLLVGSLLPLF